MNLSFLTLYDSEVRSFFHRGVIHKAIQSGILSLDVIQLRDYADPPHHKVDDAPFSKRQGMLLRYDVMQRALLDAPDEVVFVMPDPTGPRFKYSDALALSRESHVYFISPAYEGVDARLFDAFDIQRYSMGDFIVPNGDSAAVLMAEAVARYVPGVVGCSDCIDDDSIVSGLLESPQYTTPRSIDQRSVPEVLLSGHHQNIDDWKFKQSVRRTLYRRPDLINQFSINESLVKIVDQIIMEDKE